MEDPWAIPPACTAIRLRRATDGAAPRLSTTVSAYYDDEHLSRLLLIRTLREEKYLPIAVIRRLLDSPSTAERDVEMWAALEKSA